jgi:SAM-dependent methyltransferase
MPDNSHARQYWQYEYDVCSRHLIPLLEQWGVDFKAASVLDVGCGEGGGICAMYDAGARCAAFDVDSHRVDAARSLKHAREITVEIGNLYDNAIPYHERAFDLVVLHDVFEHLEHKDRMMQKLKRYMKRDARLVITFPPYYSAYGAHQQHLKTVFAKMPFFHLIPLALSVLLPRLKGEDPGIVDEVQKLGRLKMGMRKFEQIAEAGGFTIARKQAYVISPNHIRFGLKPIPAGPVAGIPILSEVLCTGVVYLLTK